MDAFQLQGLSLDTLRRVDLPEPQPGPGQVRVRVAAASINYRDYALASGRYLPELPRPFVPLSDGVGRVDALGPDVQGVALGERVIGHYTTAWREGPFQSRNHMSKLGGPLDGWLAQWIVLPADALAPAPAYLDDLAASTLPVSGLTAWNALQALDLAPGASVLVQGSGSVSLMALQLAVARGLDAIVTTGEPGRADWLRSLGARAVLDYRRPDLAQALRAATDGRGVDGVVEVAGGASLRTSLEAAADNAHIAVVGFLQGREVPGDVIGPILARRLNLHGISVGSLADLRAFLAELERRRLQPVVGRVHGFDEGAQAIAALGGARSLGKPVVRVG